MDTRVKDSNERPALLLVDDDDVYSAVLGRALARRGFDVRIARGVSEAVILATCSPPEYAVVDLKLPDGSGLKLVSKLLSLDAQTRIVVLTGHGSIPSAVEAIKLGATYYLVKPVTAGDLVVAFDRDGGDEEFPINDQPMSISRVEWEHIHHVLRDNDGNVSATARALSMHRRTLQRKLAKHPVRS